MLKGEHMRRKLSLAVAGALVLAVASITLASASSPNTSGAKGDADRVQVIHLVVRAAQEAELDLGEEGFGLGDQLVFSETLFRDGKKVGVSGGACQFTFVATDSSKLLANCVATLSLPRGQVTVQGLLNFAEEGPFVVAITGGTGAYRTAHGQMRIALGETEDRYTLHLIL